MKISNEQKSTIEHQIKETIDKLPTVSFKNKHGEVFTIHASSTQVFMSGDEVDAMVDEDRKLDGKHIYLFNEAFSVWNIDEIRLLGKALVSVADKVKAKDYESKHSK